MTYMIDPDDAGDDFSRDTDSLRHIIVSQGMQETGIFVLLFTSDTLVAEGRATSGDRVNEVDRAAADLGLDRAHLDLFTDDAYLLQAALGERTVPDPA